MKKLWRGLEMPEPVGSQAGGNATEGGNDIIYGLELEDRTGPIFEKFDKKVDDLTKKLSSIDISQTTDALVSNLRAGLEQPEGSQDLLGGLLGSLGNLPTNLSDFKGLLAGLPPQLLLVGGAVVTVVGALAQFVMECGEVTKVADTLGVTLEVIGNKAGYTTSQLEDYENQLKSVGMTTIQSRQALIQATMAEVDYGKAVDLAKVAQDAAVVSGMSTEEAYKRLVSAVGNLSDGQLKQLGLTVNLRAEEAKYAAQLGIGVESLSRAEKQQALYNAVMREGVEIQGAYAAALETPAKLASEIPLKIQEIKNVIGEMAQPATLEFLKFLNEHLEELLGWVSANEETFQQLGLAIGNIVGGVLDFVEALLEAIANVTVLGQAIKAAFPEGADPMKVLNDGLRTFNQLAAMAKATISGLSAAMDAANSGADVGKAYWDAYNNSIYESAKAMGMFEDAAQSAEQTQQNLMDALVQANMTLNKFKEQVDREEADQQVQRQRRDYEQALQQSWQRQDIERNSVERIREIVKDADKQKQKAAENMARERLRIEEDYYRRIKQMMDDFNFEATELARKRDAVGLLALTRRHKRELEKEKENYAYRKSDAARQYRDTLADMDKATKEQLQKAEEARVKEIENFERQLARQRQLQALHDKWEEEDRKKQYQRQLNDLIKQMMSIDNITREGLQQLLNDWQWYFNQLGIIGSVSAAQTKIYTPPLLKNSKTGNIGQAGLVSSSLAYAMTPGGLGNAPSLGRIPAVPAASSSDRREIHVTVDGNGLDPYMQRLLVNTLMEVERNRGV